MKFKSGKVIFKNKSSDFIYLSIFNLEKKKETQLWRKGYVFVHLFPVLSFLLLFIVSIMAATTTEHFFQSAKKVIQYFLVSPKIPFFFSLLFRFIVTMICQCWNHDVFIYFFLMHVFCSMVTKKSEYFLCVLQCEHERILQWIIFFFFLFFLFLIEWFFIYLFLSLFDPRKGPFYIFVKERNDVLNPLQAFFIRSVGPFWYK